MYLTEKLATQRDGDTSSRVDDIGNDELELGDDRCVNLCWRFPIF